MFLKENIIEVYTAKEKHNLIYSFVFSLFPTINFHKISFDREKQDNLKSGDNKRKNKKKWTTLTKNLLHSKRSHQRNEKAR